MPLIRLPLIVIDQNALRTEALLEPALQKARTHGAKLLLIDMAFLEMAKNEHWETTLRRSLAILSKDPDHVCLGTGIPDLFRRENDSQQPCFDQIVDEERTATVRELLGEVASGRDGRAMEYLRENIADAQTSATAQYLNHERNKKRVIKFRDVWKDALTQEQTKIAKRDRSYRRELLASPSLTNVIEQSLIKGGVSQTCAKALAPQRGITVHSLFASANLALKWFVEEGLDSAKAASVTNDRIDQDYVTTASFCDSLITLDADVIELCEDLIAVAELRESQTRTT